MALYAVNNNASFTFNLGASIFWATLLPGGFTESIPLLELLSGGAVTPWGLSCALSLTTLNYPSLTVQ